MASLKAERPEGSQSLGGQPKKEPAKAGDGPSKAPKASKPASKKAEQPKPREPKKKAKAGKSTAKN